MYQTKQDSGGQHEENTFNNYTEIINSLVRTRDEANMLLSEIDLLKDSIYKLDSGNFTETLENSIRAKTSGLLAPLFIEKNQEEILTNLKKEIESINYLGLTIAFEPTQEVIRKIISWVRQNVGNNLALDIHINTSILGGALIEYNGKVGGSTVLSGVNEYLLNNANF